MFRSIMKFTSNPQQNENRQINKTITNTTQHLSPAIRELVQQHKNTPERLFNFSGSTLDIFVWSRINSVYITQCLERISRFVEFEYRLFVFGDANDKNTAKITQRYDGQFVCQEDNATKQMEEMLVKNSIEPRI